MNLRQKYHISIRANSSKDLNWLKYQETLRTIFPKNLQQLENMHLSFGNLPLTLIAAGKMPSTEEMSEDRVQYFQQLFPACRLL